MIVPLVCFALVDIAVALLYVAMALGLTDIRAMEVEPI